MENNFISEFKNGDNVVYIGATDAQVRWGGGNSDPRKMLTKGNVYTIKEVEVHSWHTKLCFVGIDGKFNSSSFNLIKK